jgi:5'-deoxynucleotidase YfbR-like HD superfamily hydrolase
MFNPEKGPKDQEEEPEKEYKIDVTQYAGTDEREKTKNWDVFAKRHLKEMRILKEAGLLGKENENWRNVSEHSLVAGALAGFLARKLEDKDQDINVELVESAAILHDVSKRIDVESGVRYDAEKKKGQLIKFFKKFDYPQEFIEMVSYAGRVPEIFSEGEEQNKAIAQKPIEQLIIAYADARIRNVNVVSLQEAREKNKEKVPKDKYFYDKWFDFYKKVESHIFEKIDDIKPEEIDNKKVSESILENE